MAENCENKLYWVAKLKLMKAALELKGYIANEDLGTSSIKRQIWSFEIAIFTILPFLSYKIWDFSLFRASKFSGNSKSKTKNKPKTPRKINANLLKSLIMKLYQRIGEFENKLFWVLIRFLCHLAKFVELGNEFGELFYRFFYLFYIISLFRIKFKARKNDEKNFDFFCDDFFWVRGKCCWHEGFARL